MLYFHFDNKACYSISFSGHNSKHTKINKVTHSKLFLAHTVIFQKF